MISMRLQKKKTCLDKFKDKDIQKKNLVSTEKELSESKMMALCHVNHTNVNVCVIGMTVMSITQTLADKCLHEQYYTYPVFPSNSQRYQLNSFLVVIFQKSNNYMLYTQYQSQVSYTDYFK